MLDELFMVESRVHFYSERAGIGIKIMTRVKDREDKVLCPQDTKDFGVWYLEKEAVRILAEQFVKERQEEVAKVFLKFRGAQEKFNADIPELWIANA